MKIGDRRYNFGRCIRVAFYPGDSDQPIYVLEHKPEIDRLYNVHMDITVTDLPSASDKDKPGYQSTVSIYNPSKQLLDIIIGGATWVSDYVDVMSKSDVNKSIRQFKTEKDSAMKKYYKSRIRATIEAGYVVDGKADYTQLIRGYVNGSSFSHKGQDDILTLGIYDFPAAEAPITEQQKYSVADIMNATEDEKHQMSLALLTDDDTEFEDTWYKTFIKYIKKYETERIPDSPQTQFDNLTKPAKDNSLAPLKNVDVPKSSYMTVPIQPEDRKTNTWFNVVFLVTRKAWDEVEVGKRNSSRSITDSKLAQKLMEQKMPYGNVTGYNLYQMLDALCSLAEVPVSWDRVIDNVSKNTYLIFPLGKDKTFVRGDLADIQIWNYQNLLESPSVDGSGGMSIKMVFNPKCVCKRTIALMLDSSITETDVTRDVGSFQSSKTVTKQLLGSMASQTSLAAFGVTQLNGAIMLAAQRKERADRDLKGYMFNVGMPIIKVEHKLSTHKADWTTTVKTVPTISGLNYGSGK